MAAHPPTLDGEDQNASITICEKLRECLEMEYGWVEKITRVLSLFSQKEVKTPLSFFFRLIFALLLVIVFAMFLCPAPQRLTVFFVGIAALILIGIGMYAFAWRSPKNLVYGESSHRAELRLGLGTEKKQISETELANLPGTPNPQALTSAEG